MKSTSDKNAESERILNTTVDRGQTQARNGQKPSVPDLEQYRRERVADLNKESAKYGRK